MDATMMNAQLGTAAILAYGERIHARSRIGFFDGAHVKWRTYAETAHRARKLAGALLDLGVTKNSRVATLSWNDFPHFEAYLAIPSIGAVLHTLNLRLHAEQIAFILADAEDSVLIADGQLLAAIVDVVNKMGCLKKIIVTGDSEGLVHLAKPWVAYEDFIEGHDPVLDFPMIDERAAAACCYTSGTTGNPKGVVYSHRTIYLHSMASMAANAFALSDRDTIMLLPPMFHANAWGLPFSGWFAGADFVLPGPQLQAPAIQKMIAATAPTFTATVPTILNELLGADARSPIDMSSFRTIVCGGSAVAEKLIVDVEQRWGFPLIQGWGMTETSPLCVLSIPAADAVGVEAHQLQAKSGRPVPGVEVRVVDINDQRLEENGVAVGRLQLRGPWIARGYHRVGDTLTDDGWFDTGDAGMIDARGYVQVTDRLKDLIKSGGEWIPSAELENHVSSLSGVDLAAVIGVPDEKWEERPLAIITTVDQVVPDFASLRRALQDKVARFWIPEFWAHIETLPLTSVGKINKQALRHAVATGKIDFKRVDANS